MSSRDLVVAAAGNSAGPSDPYFEYNTLLLTGDGTNGAQNNTFLDSSTNNFTITRNGNTTQGTFSPYGNLWSNYFPVTASTASSFGTGQYLATASNSAFALGSGSFTLECWYCPQAKTKNYPRIFQIGDGSNTWGNNNSWALLDRHDSAPTKFSWACYSLGVNSMLLSSTTTVQNGIWYHIAIVRNGSTFTMFINGVAEATYTNSGSVSSSSTCVALVGSAGSGDSDGNGYISNLRLVKGTAVYTSNFTPSTAPLTAIANTSLLTCQSNRFIDNSSNNFTLTVNGTPSVQRFSPFNPTAPYSASTIGGSGYFDGTGDYLATPSTGNPTFSGDFTIGGWFYPTSLAQFGVFSSYSGSNYFECSFLADGTFAFYANSSTNTKMFTAAKYVPNQWNYFTLSRTGTTITATINGVSAGTVTVSGTLGYTSSMAIGGYAGGTYCINGYISDFRIINGSAVTAVPTTPLTAITNTSLLCNFTNAGIPDAAMQNDLETVGNAQVSTSVKKYGTGSLYFDGSGDWLSIPSNNALSFGSSDFTIECWMYWSGNNGDWTLCNKAGDWRLAADTNRWVYSANPGVANVFLINWTPTTGTWYHVACVRNGTTTTMYINGTSIGSGTSANTQGATNPLTIGAFSDGSYPFTGYIDDLRITKGVARYTANFTPPAQALPTQ